MRAVIVFLLLLKLKYLSRLFYRFETTWVGEPGKHPWSGVRLLAFLNHTSLFEPLFAAVVPNHFLWRLASRGVLPAAQKTIDRPLTGLFFRLVASRVVPISRKRDATWDRFLEAIGNDSMVALAPEGRMRRATGLDSKGQPMTVRGGIADILEAIPEGPMLLAYSGGLHHVQIPGQRWPRLFKTLRIRLEIVDVREYRENLRREAGEEDFKRAVIADLEARRDRHAPILPGTTSFPPSTAA